MDPWGILTRTDCIGLRVWPPLPPPTPCSQQRIQVGPWEVSHLPLLGLRGPYLGNFVRGVKRCLHTSFHLRPIPVLAFFLQQLTLPAILSAHYSCAPLPCNTDIASAIFNPRPYTQLPMWSMRSSLKKNPLFNIPFSRAPSPLGNCSHDEPPWPSWPRDV